VDLLDLLESRITPEIRELAAQRIIVGGNVAARTDLDRETKKIVLVLVYSLAPVIVFTQAEAALIYGINRKSVPGRTSANTPYRINVGKG
jgi:hypothetical protein